MLEPVLGAVRPHDLAVERLIYRLRDAALVADLRTGRILLWNPAAASLFGYVAEEALGMPMAALLPEDTRQQLGRRQAGLLAEALASPRPLEFPAIRKDGSAIVAAMTVSPLACSEDEPQRVLAILREVTERRCLLEARDRLLNVVSHELRTPLSTILGFGGLVLDELAGPLTPDQRHYLQRMVSCAEDLHLLVNDLLDLGQIQTGHFMLHPQTIDFDGVVGEVLEGLTPLATAKHLTLLNELPQGLARIHADGKRVAQVLRNLVSNAIKFTPEGGRVRVRGCLDGDALRCEIEDTGPGIHPDEQPLLFQPFVRLGGGALPGTGLGLSIAKALVEAHQGTIGVCSNTGQGAVFWFSLPLTR